MSINKRIAVVTQETSKTTTVVAPRYEGIIETVNLTDAAGASFVFRVENDRVQRVANVVLTPEYPQLNGITTRAVTLTGTSGTANIVVGGINYLATFTSSLTTSATNFVTSHGATLLALGITVTADTGVLTFSATTTIFPTISVSNVSGDLAGTVAAVSNTVTTGLPIVTLAKVSKGYFDVRVTNVGSVALNCPVKVHFKMCHN